MMKKLFLLLLTSVFAYIGNTQTIIYEDDFESYTVGQGLAGQNTMWIVWPGGEDAPVVTEQAQSGTKSVKLFGAGDLVLPMGKISGKYQVDFYYYIPTGFGGYYNFQRLPSPGVEWVAEVYFANNGTGYINAGGENTATFNYPQNQWVHIKNVIDIDDDWGEIFINNTLIYGWQWSLTSAGGISPHGTQLGGLNIYAGAPPLQTATYFMDDFSFIELEEGNLPVIVVSPDEFEVDVPSGQTATDDLLVENDGTAALNYSIEANYVFSSMKNVPIKDYQEPIEELSGYQHKNNIDMIVDMPDSPDKVSYSPPKDDYLTYAGPNATGVGFTDPIIFEVAARFPNSITLPYAGMQLTQVNVYLYHTDNCTFRIKVYGEGSDFEPGDVYVDQLFSTSLPGEYQITLVNPITITGEDLWIGYRVVQGLGGIFPIGADAGPANPNGHFIKPGAGWSVSNQDRNWNISGVLTGQGITQWLSFSPATGTIDPNDDEVHTVNFDASNLAMGEYEAILKLKSNDIINPLVTIPVTLNVGAGNLLDPPTNLTGVVDGYDVHLNWDAPGGVGEIEELIYDNNVNTGAYSYNGWTMSTRMTPAGACQILAMKFFTTGTTAFNATLFEWAGSQPSTTILYQQNVNAVANDWMEVDVAGQNIFFTGQFVVGFGSINATTYLGYDGALNNGRSWDYNNGSQAWEAWTEAYLIRAIVQYTDGTIAEIAPGYSLPVSVNAVNNIAHPGDYSNVEIVKPIDKIVNSPKTTLTGYNIYRGGVKIADVPAAVTNYIDENLSPGVYQYFVTAVYDDAPFESGPSNTWTADVITSINESGLSSTQIFPNPAKNIVNIQSGNTIYSVTVYNFTGQIVANENVNDNTYRFNSEDLKAGIYIFHINTSNGTVMERVVIQ